MTRFAIAVGDVAGDEHDPFLQQPRVDVVRAFSARVCSTTIGTRLMRRSLADALAPRRIGPPKAAAPSDKWPSMSGHGAGPRAPRAKRRAMNTLTEAQRDRVLAMLREGKTLRRIEHETGHRRETIAAYGRRAGLLGGEVADLSDAREPASVCEPHHAAIEDALREGTSLRAVHADLARALRLPRQLQHAQALRAHAPRAGARSDDDARGLTALQAASSARRGGEAVAALVQHAAAEPDDDDRESERRERRRRRAQLHPRAQRGDDGIANDASATVFAGSAASARPHQSHATPLPTTAAKVAAAMTPASRCATGLPTASSSTASPATRRAAATRPAAACRCGTPRAAAARCRAPTMRRAHTASAPAISSFARVQPRPDDDDPGAATSSHAMRAGDRRSPTSAYAKIAVNSGIVKISDADVRHAAEAQGERRKADQPCHLHDPDAT